MKWKLRLTLMTKMVVGFLLGLLIARVFNLPYAFTAGVITVLSLEMTKKKSYTIGLIRIFAVVIGLGLATLLFWLFGYDLWVLILLVAVFISTAFIIKIEGGIVVTLVLISQLYLERNYVYVINASYIFVIGLVVATLLNFWMPPLRQAIAEEIASIDQLLDHKIQQIAEGQDVQLDDLIAKIGQGTINLRYDLENRLSWKSDARQAYLNMRERQVAILGRINLTIKQIENIPQKGQILEFLKTFSGQIGEQNYAAGLRVELDKLFEFFRGTPLPESRFEFEQRAQLYYILKELEIFLNLKLVYHQQYQLTMSANKE